MNADYSELLARLIAFREERDWAQFHTPRHLAAALGIEVAELQELMLWKTDEDIDHFLHDSSHQSAFADELGDVLIYLMLLSDRLGIDLLEAAAAKIDKNARKYPADRARGNAKKYTEFEG